MTSAALPHLTALVRHSTRGTPYAVRETDEGFDLSLDVIDTQSYGLLHRSGLKQTFIHHVRFHDDGRYSITDDARQLDWSAGIARIGMSVRRSRVGAED